VQSFKLILLACMLAALPVLARAGGDVRGGEHSGFGRLVLEWPETGGSSSLTYILKQDGRRVSLTVTPPLTAPVDRARASLSRYVDALVISADGGTVSLTLTDVFTIRDYREGNKIVLDFRRSAAAGASQPDSTATPASHKASSPPPPAKTPAAKTPIPPATQITTNNRPTQPVLPAPEPAAKTALPPAAEAPSLPETLPPAVAVPILVPAAQTGQQQATPGAAFLVPTASETSFALTLGFPWTAETRAAVFRRAGFVWIVFDRPAQLDLGSLRSAGLRQLNTIEAMTHPTATVLRLQTAAGLNPTLWRRGTAWQVDLRPQDARAEVDVTVQAEVDALLTPRLRLALPGLGEPLAILDPAAGDTLWIVPTSGMNHGVTRERQFPQLLLPATAQGLVVVPLASDLRVVAEPDAVTVTALSGLSLSSRPDDPDAPDSLTPGRQGRLFNLRRWHTDTDDFAEQRQALQQAVLDAPKSRRNVRRLLLAEFLFAHGYASEARGVLEVVGADDPALAQLPLYRGLLGAALVLDNRVAEGLALLRDDRLNRFPEIQLWRGAALARLDRTAEAQAALATAPGLPDDYGPPLAMAVTPAVQEKAGRLLDDVGTLDLTGAQRSRLHYLAARRMLANNKIVAGRQLLERLANGNDHWSRTRAALALIELGRKQGHLPADQAIAKLERLRFAWRGDAFEFRILQSLADLLLTEKRYRYGMQTLAKAIRRFPDLAKEHKLQEQLQTTFTRLYLDGEADALPPLQALSLFDEFRDLTPEDTSGDTMIRKLADRLVAVDLLDRAAMLLEHQIRQRLTGAARGQTGAHLALIRLLDRKPDEALKALDLSTVEDIPDAVRTERRLLRARAVMMQDKRDEALALIADDTSTAADRLRAEIYWDSERYPLLIATLQRLVQVPATATALTDRQAQGLVNLAMALSLNQDYQQLGSLRTTYSAVMAKTPYQRIFDTITRTPEDTDVSTFADISSQFAEIRNFESFLEDYRQRIRNAGTLAAEPAHDNP
jgi:hypothetical protein